MDTRDARATVLARLWSACAREPLDGVLTRRTGAGQLELSLAGPAVRTARGPLLPPFAAAPADLAIDLDDERITDPVALLRAIHPPTPERDRFAEELANCVTNLALARSAPRPAYRPGHPRRLADLEQLVVDGHPLHPLCRTRMGMSADEIRRYAPEFRPVVEVPVMIVPPERWLCTGTGLPPLLPMHPWQADHVDHGLRPSGQTLRGRPLMSLRTLALIDDPGWHLKTALDVQMTSAVRIVSPAAVHNGPVMSALLRRMTAGSPIDILDEVAAGAVLVDGAPSRSLAMVRRRAPRLRPDEIAVPFGVLSAGSPAFITGQIGVGGPVAYFDRLMRLAVPPLLRLLGAGVALEAHGQNLLVVLRDHEPVRLLYRDMGGIRVSPRRLAAAGFEPPDLTGDLVTDDPDALRTKLAAAFLSTVVAELVATLGREYGTDPADLWRSVATIVRSSADTPDHRADSATMVEAALPIKATTAMRLSAEPLEDIWTPVENPMASL